MCNLTNIRSIRPFLSLDTCKTIVLNLVISHLDYCNSLYYGLPKYEIDRLQRIQNAAAKLVVGYNKFDSPREAMKILHWLPIQARIEFKIGVLVFRCLSGEAPSYLIELLSIKPHRSSMRSTGGVGASTLNVPRNKHKTLADRSFAFSGPVVWNSIPPAIRLSKNISMFRKSFKAHLFKNVYQC